MSQAQAVDERDELTGLLTMPAFFSQAARMVEEARAGGDYPAIVFFDVENFKAFNHRYGFEDGNEFLSTVARILAREFDKSVLGHFSSDHFCVCTRSHAVIDHVNRAHERVHAYQREVKLELKAGIYITTAGDDEIGTCCDRAMLACDSTKSYFDEVWVLYDQAFDERIQQQQYVVSNLDEALDKGWIEAFYQPVMRVSTGELCGMEALARWKDPVRGYLAPSEFIGTLERLHLIARLDERMISLVCQRIRDELAAGRPVVPVSLNLSRLDFELADITGYLEGEVERAGIPHELLDIEITESALAGDRNLLHHELRELHQQGHALWMDDFGSGYSSLNSFKDLGLDFDLIKFDMDFLRDFEDHPQTKIIMSSMASMASQLGTQTLAEGVETPEQLDFLGSIGCDKAQGFLFSKPVPYEELRSLARERGWKFEQPATRAYLDGVLDVDVSVRPQPKADLASASAASPVDPQALWNAGCSLCSLGLFWKDKDRRFLGVNQAFLDYYGLVSPREVLGRTDEEMGWHIEADPYRDDEVRVLAQGAETRRVRGMCIRHGEVRNIVASKVPVMQDGEVIGLLGYFEDVTDELRRRLDPEAEAGALTGGVLDDRNFEMVLENYEAAYARQGADFAYVQLRIRDAYGYDALYGAGYANQVSARVVEAIRDLLGNRGVVHHQSGSSLIVVKQVCGEAQARALVGALKDCVASLHEVEGGGIPVDVDCGACRYSEAGSLTRLQELAERRVDGR